MKVVRWVGSATAGALMLGALVAGAPAQAQFYFKSKDITGAPILGDEPGIGQPMPGATPAELKAGMVWNMRAALNVAALQCQFEPSLLTVANYNAILADHRDELKTSFDALGKYFARTAGSAKAGQTALDQFGTRTYAGFATVAAQYNFCKTASDIGRSAIFRPRGEFGALSLERMRELRNSLTPFGEQAFTRVRPAASLPRFDKQCWSGKGYNELKCGGWTYPYAVN